MSDLAGGQVALQLRAQAQGMAPDPIRRIDDSGDDFVAAGDHRPPLQSGGGDHALHGRRADHAYVEIPGEAATEP